VFSWSILCPSVLVYKSKGFEGIPTEYSISRVLKHQSVDRNTELEEVSDV
jgi:hypothetical protein